MNKDLSKVLRDLQKKKTSREQEAITVNILNDGLASIKGLDGYTPQKGVDYMTPAEVDNFVSTIFNAAKPKYGVDYYTDSDKRKFVAEVLKLATPIKGIHYRDGIDGRDGKDGKDGVSPDAKSVAIDAINFLENFEGDARLSAKALRDLDEAVTDILKNGKELTFTEGQIKTIKDLLPQYPPINAGGSGATFLKSLRDVDLSGLTKNADGKYVLGAGGSGSGIVETIVAGTGITVDDTDPANPIVSATASAPAWGDITGTLADQTDLQNALNAKQDEAVVVSSNQTAANDQYYINVASATYTDPSPTEGKGFIVLVRNGTATIGGTGYSTAGTLVYRIYHSGAWANYVYQVSSTFALASHTHTASQITDFDTATDARIASAAGVSVASLSGGKVPTSQLPALALTDVFIVASQVAQLALTAEEGDVAIRTDENKSYIHNGGVSGTIADWSELLTPTDTVLSVNGEVGTVTLTTDDISDSGQTNKWSTSAEKTKLGHITVTQAVDLDTIESDTATNNAKVTNATHTGEVTGATALIVDKTAITNKTTVTPVAGDFVLISDTSDSGNLKKVDVTDFLGGGGGGITEAEARVIARRYAIAL